MNYSGKYGLDIKSINILKQLNEVIKPITIQ